MLKRYSFLFILFTIFIIFGYENLNSFTKNFVINSFRTATKEFENEIDNKLKSTMAISLTLANDPHLYEIFKNKNSFLNKIKTLPSLYKKYTNYKNIWIQIFDKNGISIYRSWSKRKGDNLSNCRDDIKYLIENPKYLKTISICKYTIGLNAISPIYENKKLLGFVETISHFNSIEKNMKKLGYEIVILADKKYKNRFKYPISKKFIDGYYIANFNIDNNILNTIKNTDIEKIIKSRNFIKSEKYYIYSYPIKDFQKNIVGWAIFLKDKNDIKSALYQNSIFLRIFIFFAVITIFIALIIFIYSKDKERALKERNIYYFNILDSLQEIIILTDGKKIKYANRRFFDYFKDYKNIEDFTKKHKCICDFFVEEEGFLPSKINNKNWIDILIENINRPYKVKIAYNNKNFIFLVKASKIKENEYAVIFIDITKNYNYEQKLQEMAIKDKLTNLYNRTFFEKISKEQIKIAKEEKEDL
ncbi:cache domain-containing protein [Nitrosophilus kaiyonis]|uniref:cache domain-containing protein n=1 Tax=Nitrosophilus kaiyonis TaxID=2930200 RepID=UPI0024928908|nr:cache domain-containing protein [Nitrosophilus kaiyonis]